MLQPLSRVRMPAQYREGPVNLLGEHGARELVRHRHLRKRNQQVAVVAPRLRQSVVSADDKHQIPARHLCFREQIGESGRIDRPPRGVEQNLLRTRMLRPEIAIRPDFRHPGRSIPVRPLDIIRCQRIGVRIFGFSGVIQKDFHSAGSGTSFASRHSRSSE